MVQRN